MDAPERFYLIRRPYRIGRGPQKPYVPTGGLERLREISVPTRPKPDIAESCNGNAHGKRAPAFRDQPASHGEHRAANADGLKEQDNQQRIRRPAQNFIEGNNRARSHEKYYLPGFPQGVQRENRYQ